MRLLLQPTIASLQNEYEPNDFMDEEQFEDEILVRQGFESEEMEVGDGEKFEIPKGMHACVINEEENPESDDYLQAGLYELDGHLVKIIRLYDEE